MKIKKITSVCVLAVSLLFVSCSGKSISYSPNDTLDSDGATPKLTLNTDTIRRDGYIITEKGIFPIGGRPLVIDFSAVWCPPCQDLKPIFESLKTEYRGRVDFVTVDTDSDKDLTKFYGISNIPTLIFMTKEGKIKMETTGFVPADSIRTIIATKLK